MFKMAARASKIFGSDVYKFYSCNEQTGLNIAIILPILKLLKCDFLNIRDNIILSILQLDMDRRVCR
jgi:hypothetical protein